MRGGLHTFLLLGRASQDPRLEDSSRRFDEDRREEVCMRSLQKKFQVALLFKIAFVHPYERKTIYMPAVWQGIHH